LAHANGVGDPSRRRTRIAEVGKELGRRVQNFFARGLARPSRLLQPRTSTAVAAHGHILAPRLRYSRVRPTGRCGMTEQLDEESAKSNEQEVKHARHVLNTAKLVVTFAAGIAATFVATSLQGRDENCWDEGAAVSLFAPLAYPCG